MQDMTQSHTMTAVTTAMFASWAIYSDAVGQGVRFLTSPYDLQRAAECAHASERTRIRTPAVNTHKSFGIASQIIKGATLRVTTKFEQVTDTCDMWRMGTAAHNDKPPMVIVSPYSGSHPTFLKHVAQGFLSERNVIVIGSPDPRNLPGGMIFDVARQTDDVITCCRKLDIALPQGFDLMGISQSGIPSAVAAALTNVPRNIIIAGGPINPHLAPTAINWMARLYNLPDNLFTHAGGQSTGRLLVMPEVMHVLYKCTPDSLDQSWPRMPLAGEHVLAMHDQIFKHNLLAQRQFSHRGQIVDLSSYTGGVITVAAEKDAICPPAQTEDAHRLFRCASRHIRQRISGGHYHLVRPGEVLLDMASKINAATLGPQLVYAA